MLRRCSVFAVFLLFVTALTLSQNKPQVYRILGITVEGQTTTDQAAIVAQTGLRVGDELTVPGEQTRTAIERLHRLRLFEDIQILIENKVQDGVYLLLRVRENPRLEQVIVSGNDELSEEDINKKINLIKGQLLTPHDISVVVRTLKYEYAQEGYLNASVSTELEPTADSTRRRVNLLVKVDEGEEVVVDRIRFHGNGAFDDDDLRGEMSETNERRWWAFWASNRFDQKKYREDKDLILSHYRKNGYRDAEIVGDSISYDDDKKYMTIDISVYEGPQYYVRNISWEGNAVYSSDVLSTRLGFTKGDIYDQERFQANLYRNESETDVTSLYSDNGYLWFQAEPKETVVGRDSVDIVLRLRERNQFRIGRVIVSGNNKTYEKVIRRELLTKPGDFFSRQLIISSVRQLSQLNYFNPEKIKPDVRPVDDKTVDLEYEVEERSSDTFNMSVGYSGAFGFNGGLGLAFNNFSLREPFKGGAGQVLTIDWQFGVTNLYRTFSIGFQEPWMFDTPTLFGFSVFDQQQRYYADYRNTGVSVRVGRRFRWPDYLFRGDWTVRYQLIKYQPFEGETDPLYSVGTSTQFGIAQVISRNSTNSPIFPAEGSSFSLSTEISGGPLFPGTARFHKHVLNLDWYIPLTPSQRITLASTNTIGTIFGFERDSYIPLLDRFSMGGTGLGQFNVTPLRGYAERSVGPQYGGTAIMKHTLELRFALALNPIPIYTLMFAEAGNVWLEPKYMDTQELRKSAGLGIRLLVNPLGLIGFDYGFGFDASTLTAGRPGWQFHFQFGRAF